MAYIVADRVKETTTVTGTGPATLAGAASGYRSFASQLSIGDTCAYVIVNSNGSEWETGIGTYSAVNTLTRTTVHASTNANAAVVFTAGVKDVFMGPTASAVLDRNASVYELGSAKSDDAYVVITPPLPENPTREGASLYLLAGSSNSDGYTPVKAGDLILSGGTQYGGGIITRDNEGRVIIQGNGGNLLEWRDGESVKGYIDYNGSFSLNPYATSAGSTNEIRFVELASNGTNYLGFKAPDSIASNRIWTLPSGDGSANQGLITNGSGVLSWATNTGTGSNVLSNAPTLTTATFAAGTISASAPNAITQTWNNAAVTFSAFTINVTDVASSLYSTLFDLQTSGTSRFSFSKFPNAGSPWRALFSNAASIGYDSGVDGITIRNANDSGSLNLLASTLIAQTGLNLGPSQDVNLNRDAADTLAQRRSTNAQTFRVYNTYTSASVYERASLSWASNVCTLTTESTTAGAGRNLIVSAGNGVTTGAGGNLILQAGIQATSGGDGKVVVKQVAGQTSNLQEWQNSSGTALLYVNSSGSIYPGTSGGASLGDYNLGFNTLRVRSIKIESGSGTFGFYLDQNTGVRVGANGAIGFSSGSADATPYDLTLFRDTANTLAQRNGTNAQAFRVYNTYTDASSYERLVMDWSTTANVGYIGFQRAGTGVARNVIVDLGGNPTAGANRIHTVGTNTVEIWSGNVQHIQCVNGTITFLGGNAYGTGATRTLGLGISAPGNANRNADKYVFRAIGYGTGNTIPTYVGFGAAYVPAGVTSTQSHTQEDCFLVRLLASATPIVAFGDSFVSTVPAIKRVGTRLQARLADDSGYATWEGPLNSNAVSAIALPTAATVTAATGDGTTVTYTAANTFSVGQVVSITGLTITTGSSLNLSNQTITTASATQFTITNATVGTAAATQAGTATIQSAGNSVTITGGNGSGVGAGGNIILQPGAQGSSGGDGYIFLRSPSGVTTGIVGPDSANNRFYLYGGSSTSNLYCQFAINFFTVGNWILEVNSANGNSYTGISRRVAIGNTTVISFHPASRPIDAVAAAALATATNGTIKVFGVAGSNEGGSFSFPSTTTAFSANTNDLSLTGSAFQRINCTSAASLTGIAPPTGGAHVDGRMIRIYNVGAANLTLAHNSASSIAANRMFNSTGADIILAPNDYAELIYDATSNGSGAAGWRVS